MQEAIATARENTEPFVVRLVHPGPTQSYAAVKTRLTEGGAVEHVWLSRVTLDGSVFRGVLDNTPVDVHRYHVGETITVSRDSITDWMVIDRDTVYGAFTVYALRARMTASECEHFDKQQGVHFGAAARLLGPVGQHP